MKPNREKGNRVWSEGMGLCQNKDLCIPFLLNVIGKSILARFMYHSFSQMGIG